ncbi:MAG: hypothetical protein EP330_04580 [Deltaproteobacteria bacterium]|nr:MAG: hypothetical protein EP330_04580 [Deltaproteobacteria bacterium]
MRMLPLVFVLACAGAEPEDTGPTAPPLTDLPTSTCGTLEYEWVPLDHMGELVEWERLPDLDMEAGLLRGVLDLAGFPADALPITYDVVMYRVRYRTQDRGRTVETTGLVSFPDAEGTFPTVAWLHGTTGFSDQCAPSGLGVEGAAGNLLLSSLGAVVASPDYLGMNGWGEPSDMLHPYVVGEPTALASLDAIRAAWELAELEAGNTEVVADRKTVLFGPSEGGGAALWSERYAPWYLPEADIVGAVASVPPTNVAGLVKHGAAEFGDTTRGLSAVLATYQDWYGIDAPLTEVYTDADPAFFASSVVDALEASCNPGSLFDGVTSTDQVYSDALRTAAAAEDWDALGEWGCAIRANTLVHAPIPRISDTPVLYVIAGADELVYHETNREDVPRLCEAGYRLEVLECEGADHVAGARDSLPEQWQWALDRLADVPFEAPCELPTPEVCTP